MAKIPEFTDPFTSREEILKLERGYITVDSQYDRRAKEAGERLCKKYSFEDFKTILQWKLSAFPWIIPRIENERAGRRKEMDSETTEALILAKNSKHERNAIAILDGLPSVGVPAASALMTWISPKRYTVIDVRALESLKVKKYNLNLDFYIRYLQFCLKASKKHRVSLRTYDRALWQKSKDKSPKREHKA